MQIPVDTELPFSAPELAVLESLARANNQSIAEFVREATAEVTLDRRLAAAPVKPMLYSGLCFGPVLGAVAA